MRFIYSKTSDAAFNLASEEYFLKSFKENIFFLYINAPSVICGKHQNVMGEIDFDFTKKNNIKVFRRLSGGGTVFHDLGNINFCFITNEGTGELVNFDKYLTYITRFLATKGLDASIGKRHELLLDGKKISGNASHVFKNRVMHHGTLLFDSKLNILNNCLRIDPLKYTDKAVKSVRSEVTNIKPYLKEERQTEEFSKDLFNWLATEFPDSNLYDLAKVDEQKIDEILKEKFNTWDWIYGYSPQYTFEKRIDIDKNTQLKAKMTIQKGIICEIEVCSTSKDAQTLASELEAILINGLHSITEIEKKLTLLNLSTHKTLHLTNQKLLELFF